MKPSSNLDETSRRSGLLTRGLSLAVIVLFTVIDLASVSPAAAQQTPQQPPQQTTLRSLLHAFSELPGLEARFREEKHIALLAVPVRSEGRIWFVNPGRLMRRVTRPDASAALIDGGQLRMRNGDQTQELSIDSNPVLRGFVESFRAVLAGDQATLERFYDAQLTPGEGDAWTLRLTPRDEALGAFVREIRMSGHGVSMQEMLMVEVNGDRTRTEFFEVNPQRRFSAREARRIFRIR
ncbi:MAG TPA: outer membrane lipoprotein carrier protein LolA [Polyangiaceae bacterium]|nr:outer membrane lipoprotein carrier protein LolA [Polyangiaceae bacterium]